ncbi:MAG: hypothetical protein A2846_00960 [Candidatus Doudnabacteria bacterium RIFCSPHIGHO2_01_FULL_49_9]|uniref:DUF4134 domain-containing protein n=1 Tax=Candidatus Doudnabacteria bacterium RIFCSPHIGHO2_01_FULL_49_9 TaxID=1817827 RepID=A0A1F5P3E1_9BACT|nr:MAG: hypothetical protein A2846_00960 [Candidatus Doudnabacteria bacterium RIFCSPHIGHO2_01_FULL_49_9]
MTSLTFSRIALVSAVLATLMLAIVPMVASAQFDPDDISGSASGLPDSADPNEFIVGVIDILLGIVGLVAVLFLIIGGFRYVTSAGNEETAEAGKKTVINAIIGIVIVILAFVIVRVVATAILDL